MNEATAILATVASPAGKGDEHVKRAYFRNDTIHGFTRDPRPRPRAAGHTTRELRRSYSTRIGVVVGPTVVVVSPQVPDPPHHHAAIPIPPHPPPNPPAQHPP